MPALLAVLAGLGAYYVVTALLLGWRGVGLGPPSQRVGLARAHRRRDWLVQAGWSSRSNRELVALLGGSALLGGLIGGLLFASPGPVLVLAGFGATFPLATARHRRAARRQAAQEAWPRLIDEIRILTNAVGRSIPQALFEAGRHAPADLHPAFRAAEREWLLSTDFARTLHTLKAELADPTADVVAETLLVAHEVGGGSLDQRLEALADDRRLDLQGRKDARARQAGARFARAFVLAVPLGMALVGLTIGNGREAYRTALGQVAVVVGVGLLVACWLWAGALMRLPDEDRVFPS